MSDLIDTAATRFASANGLARTTPWSPLNGSTKLRAALLAPMSR